jgi:putative membrane protein
MLTLFSDIRWEEIRLVRWPVALIGSWLLVMVALPIVKWMWGNDAMQVGVLWGVLLQAAAVVSVLRLTWTWSKIGRIALFITLFTLSVEAIGIATGWPFGGYMYTDRLQPQIAAVPLLIPIAWFMMLPAAWAAAAGYTSSRWTFAAVSAAALTAWDLFLDPQMVSWGFWTWHEPGGYFGIPWLNFLGWFLCSALLTAVVRPGDLPRRPLLLIFGITWFLETVGLAVFWRMPGPALIGGLIMGAFGLVAWRRLPT